MELNKNYIYNNSYINMIIIIIIIKFFKMMILSWRYYEYDYDFKDVDAIIKR